MDEHFDFVSQWHRQENVPLVLFSAALWDQLGKILNRDLVFPFFAAAASLARNLWWTSNLQALFCIF